MSESPFQSSLMAAVRHLFPKKNQKLQKVLKNVLQTFSACPFQCDKDLHVLLLMEQRNIIKSLSGNEGRSRLNEHYVPGTNMITQ